jgi:hypothetical protein
MLAACTNISNTQCTACTECRYPFFRSKVRAALESLTKPKSCPSDRTTLRKIRIAGMYWHE